MSITQTSSFTRFLLFFMLSATLTQSSEIKKKADASPINVNRVGMQFPTYTFSNLAKQKKKIPDELKGDFKLMIVAFQRDQQALVDTWFPIADKLEEIYKEPGKKFNYYEIPTIYKMGFIRRALLNAGMRTGVREQAARERTFTIYIDKDPFKQILHIPHENDIYLFLLDGNGKIIWRCQGKHSNENEKSLVQYLEKLNA